MILTAELPFDYSAFEVEHVEFAAIPIKVIGTRQCGQRHLIRNELRDGEVDAPILFDKSPRLRILLEDDAWRLVYEEDAINQFDAKISLFDLTGRRLNRHARVVAYLQSLSVVGVPAQAHVNREKQHNRHQDNAQHRQPEGSTQEITEHTPHKSRSVGVSRRVRR